MKIQPQLHPAMSRTLLLLVLAGLLPGCGAGSSGSGNSPFVSIAVHPVDNRLAVGKTEQFTAIGTYADGSTSLIPGSSLSWNSSSPSVATITPTGTATAVAPGQTTITSALGTISSATTLTVPATKLVSLSITPSNPAIAIHTTQQFTVTGAYSDGSFQVLTSAVTWSSSNTSTALIAPDGTASANAVGSTTITATLGGISANTGLNVTPATLQSIEVTPSDPVIGVGTTQQFVATGTFSDGVTQNLTAQVTWSASPDSIAGVSPDGKAAAFAAGSTTIAATLGSISASTTLQVTPATLQSIAITPSDPVLAAGTTQQFIATGIYSDGTNQDLTTQVGWSSSFSSVAEITPNGKVTAVTKGATAITAAFGGESGSTSLNVTDATVTGTWEGTYTIYDSVDPSQIGTYTFRLVLDQREDGGVTGSSALRFDTPGQVEADGVITEASVVGRRVNFIFTYINTSAMEMVNIGTATITHTSMTGDVLENYDGGYNAGYIFSLKKL